MISVDCPEGRRTKTRRKKKSKVYSSKQWKEKVKEFVKGKRCEWCGSTEKLLAHHPYRDTPDAIYEDLYLSGCIVLCNTCHFMFHRRHKRKCPACLENWMDLDVDICYSCHLKANPDLKQKIQDRKEKREADRKQINKDIAEKRRLNKKKHPCKHYRSGGKCGVSKIGTRCPYGVRTAAKKCPDYEEKVRK